MISMIPTSKVGSMFIYVKGMIQLRQETPRAVGPYPSAEPHHDDFLDHLKKPVWVCVFWGIIWLIFGYFIFNIAESGNLANVEMNYKDRSVNIKLMKDTWLYLEDNKMITPGFYAI